MTISQALKSAIEKLNSFIIDSPYLEAELLLSRVIKKTREFILAHGEKKLTSSQAANLKSLVNKRLKGQPIAYLTGHKEFYGLDFIVNQNVLIPRPETELMVEEALRITQNAKRVALADIGTGSGCIIISLAKQLESRIKNYELWGMDISAKALTVAKKNAKFHGTAKNIKFLKGNLMEPILKFVIRHSSLVILANLPYLTPAQIKNSPTIKREPKSALDGGPDGLKYYHELFKQIKGLRAANYELRDLHVLCEIDSSQTKKMKRLIKQNFPQASVQIKKDLCGHERLVIAKIV